MVAILIPHLIMSLELEKTVRTSAEVLRVYLAPQTSVLPLVHRASSCGGVWRGLEVVGVVRGCRRPQFQAASIIILIVHCSDSKGGDLGSRDIGHEPHNWTVS